MQLEVLAFGAARTGVVGDLGQRLAGAAVQAGHRHVAVGGVIVHPDHSENFNAVIHRRISLPHSSEVSNRVIDVHRAARRTGRRELDGIMP